MLKFIAVKIVFPCICVLAVISGFSTPKYATNLSIAGFHLLGNGTGAFKEGVGELAPGYREAANSGGSQSYVRDYPQGSADGDNN